MFEEKLAYQLDERMRDMHEMVDNCHNRVRYQTHFTALCLGLPGLPSTRKVKPIWILLKQETVGGSGIVWAICKSAPRPRHITTPGSPPLSFLGRMPFLLPIQRQNTEA